jgi:hypothetical protein
MPRCPFAEFRAISGPSGPNVGGPFKIIHHTTEGSSAAGAFAAFKTNRSDPHFTVDGMKIFQHIDTNEAARALRNAAGGVQTNRDSAIQIELVGFAGSRKNIPALQNVARLCRWLEATHAIPQVWPNGPPRPHNNGRDPGGHNRDAATWDSKSGHYGHSQVPENSHWDPGYDKVEFDFLMTALFDDTGRLLNRTDPRVAAAFNRPLQLNAAEPEIMEDHAFVDEE